MSEEVTQNESETLSPPAVPAETVPASVPETAPAPSAEEAPAEQTTQIIPPSAGEPPSSQSPARPTVDYPAIGRQAKTKKREARLEKIMQYVREKSRITNDEIQKLLGVSDATATRYAHDLMTRNVLRRVGRGKGSYYQI
jgi:hypothetical protein